MPDRLNALLRQFRRDEEGVVAIVAAFTILFTLVISMLVIDLGSAFYAKRDFQAATDAATIGAIRQLDGKTDQLTRINNVVDFVYRENGYGADQTKGQIRNKQVLLGLYEAEANIHYKSRFTPVGSTTPGGALVTEQMANALRVEGRIDAPAYFSSLFGFGRTTDVGTYAVASSTEKLTSFSAGTRLADINDGMVNQLLTGFLGINVNLVNYNQLANVDLNAISFLDALAVRKGLTVGDNTYDDLLKENVTIGDIEVALRALADDACDPACTVPRNVFANIKSAGGSVPLNKILDIAPFIDKTIGSVGKELGAGLPLNAFNLLMGSAMAFGEGKAVGINLTGLTAPLLSATVTLRVGQAKAHVAIGKVGDFVQTSQVTLLINTEINTNAIALLGAKISLPVYITAASGKAEIAQIPCTSDGTQVVLAGTTGIATARLGETSPPVIATLELVGIPVIDLTASGNYSAGSKGPQNFPFTQSNIDNKTVKTLTSDVKLLTGLSNSITIERVMLAGSNNFVVRSLIGPLITSVLNSVLSIVSVITSALGVLDPVVDQLLSLLGIKLGSMDMIVHGVKCSGAGALAG